MSNKPKEGGKWMGLRGVRRTLQYLVADGQRREEKMLMWHGCTVTCLLTQGSLEEELVWSDISLVSNTSSLTWISRMFME